jgi:copper chaperone CopZ
MKKSIFFVVFYLLISNYTIAQITSISIAVDGLTCSACSFATQKSLLQLDFVADVQMDLNTNIALVTFKPDKKVSVQMLAQKVMDAGFSVGSLTAVFNLDGINITSDNCFTYQGDKYRFLSVNDKKIAGKINLKFVGEHFMRKKDFKHWKNVSKEPCKATDGSVPDATLYFVIPA